jgi:hypothetical protein
VNGDFQVPMTQTRIEKLKLLPTEAVRIADTLEGKNANLDMQLKERMPIIKCDCGTEILLLPDLHAMDRAINTHVTEHRKKGRNGMKNIEASSNICQILSQRSISKISELNNI